MDTYLQQWFNEASFLPIYTINNTQVVFYKGFKLTSSSIENIRLNDFYTKVSKHDLTVLKKEGFIKGTDSLSYSRAIRREGHFIKVLEQLYQTKFKLQSPEIIDKLKLNNCKERILHYTDLLFFYKAKALQYEEKYGIEREIDD